MLGWKVFLNVQNYIENLEMRLIYMTYMPRWHTLILDLESYLNRIFKLTIIYVSRKEVLLVSVWGEQEAAVVRWQSQGDRIHPRQVHGGGGGASGLPLWLQTDWHETLLWWDTCYTSSTGLMKYYIVQDLWIFALHCNNDNIIVISFISI
jgi:hypothetical protein